MNSKPSPVTSPEIDLPNPTPAKKRFPWLQLLGFLLAPIFLYFALRGLNWSDFWKIISTGKYEYVPFILALSSLSYFIRSLRWRILVQSEKPVPVSAVFWTNMVGYLGNIYLPARAGELLRSTWLGVRTGLGVSFVLATALVERLMDVVALVLFSTITLLIEKNLSDLLLNAVRLAALGGMVGLGVILAAPFLEIQIQSIVLRLPLPLIWRQRAEVQIGRFLSGMRSLHSPYRLLGFVGLTIVIWLLDAAGVMIVARVILQEISLGNSLIFLSALGLSSAIPSTPGYVGVYQFVAVAVLVPFGFSQSNALALILLSQVINYLLVTFLGGIGMWRLKSTQKV